jgi:hypothetical protein
VNCSRCGQPLGIVSYTVTIWVGDTDVSEVLICSTCGGAIGDAQIRTPTVELDR